MTEKLIDLAEIPPAHGGGAELDRFEMFARDFLIATGLVLVDGPGRGTDGGRDLIMEEVVSGTLSEKRIRWLVSAKHKAASGQTVGPADEGDISDRVRAFGAHGFIGFYSTSITSGLDTRLSGLRDKCIDAVVYDAGRIETALVGDARCDAVFRTYLPRSYQKVRGAAGSVVPLKPMQAQSLRCDRCHKELLGTDAIVASVVKVGCDPHRVVDMYWCCRGACDAMLSKALTAKESGTVTEWNSLGDLSIPFCFVQSTCGMLNAIYRREVVFDEAAFEKWKTLFIVVSQLVMREATPAQADRIQKLRKIPQCLGGLG